MAVKFFRIVSYVLMVFGGVFVFGSVEPELGTPVWYTAILAVAGFGLGLFGWRMYVATEPRKFFLSRH